MDELIGMVPENATSDYQLVKAVLKKYQEDICAFCLGHGHSASKCSTKRELDRVFRRMKLGYHWGEVKSKVYSVSLLGRHNIDVVARTEKANLIKKRVKGFTSTGGKTN